MRIWLSVTMLFFCSLAWAQEEKKAEPAPNKEKLQTPSETAWKNTSLVSTVTGEIVKIDETTLIIKIPKTVLKPGRGGSGRRPPQPQRVIEYDEFHLTITEDTAYRVPKLPAKLDENNKKIPYSSKELAALKAPQWAKGYHVDPSELKVGHLVQLTLVRPRSISASKTKPEDLLVKQVMILGDSMLPNSKKK